MFRNFGLAREGGQVLHETASFEVGAGVEYTLVSAPMQIDVSDFAITLQVIGPFVGVLAFLRGTTFEFEIMGDLQFVSAHFDLDASTCCVVDPEKSLPASRLEVEASVLRIDMSQMGGASGQTIVIHVQTVPEPHTAALIAIGLVLLSVRSRAARCPTRRCS